MRGQKTQAPTETGYYNTKSDLLLYKKKQTVKSGIREAALQNDTVHHLAVDIGLCSFTLAPPWLHGLSPEASTGEQNLEFRGCKKETPTSFFCETAPLICLCPPV